MEQIEAREFTWCSAFYPAILDHRRFVVMTPDKREAQERAVTYATVQWGEPASVNVYPRTYVRKARAAYAAGLHD